jgi:hypothetical protein
MQGFGPSVWPNSVQLGTDCTDTGCVKSSRTLTTTWHHLYDLIKRLRETGGVKDRKRVGRARTVTPAFVEGAKEHSPWLTLSLLPILKVRRSGDVTSLLNSVSGSFWYTLYNKRHQEWGYKTVSTGTRHQPASILCEHDKGPSCCTTGRQILKQLRNSKFPRRHDTGSRSRHRKSSKRCPCFFFSGPALVRASNRQRKPPLTSVRQLGPVRMLTMYLKWEWHGWRREASEKGRDKGKRTTARWR